MKKERYKVTCQDCNFNVIANKANIRGMKREHEKVEGHTVNDPELASESLTSKNESVERLQAKVSDHEQDRLNEMFKELEGKLVTYYSLSALSELCNNLAREKGWHEEDRTFGDIISLIHSEASEALEEHREGKDLQEVYWERYGIQIGELGIGAGATYQFSTGQDPHFPLDKKPEGIPIELADILIRVLDFCGEHDIDIMEAVRVKLLYNLGREHRHGGKTI